MNSITGKEIIHIFEHSKLSSDCFTEDAVSAAYVNALAALREKQEREKGCAYCKEQSQIKEEYTVNKNPESFTYNIPIRKLVFCKGSHAKPDEKYCKYCGRKLTEDA